MSRSDRGGSAASDQIGLEMGSPPSAFGISPARGAKGTHDSSLPPCGGRCHGVTEGGSAASDQMAWRWGAPPLPSASPPQGGRRGLMIPLSPPCGGRCHGVTEGGSAASDQIGLAMGSPPLPSASPPQGGRRGLIQRVPGGTSTHDEAAEVTLTASSVRASTSCPGSASRSS